VSVWCLSADEAFRFDGIRRFGRPPVLAPPAWALVERVWRGIGAAPAPAPTGAEGSAAGGVEALTALAAAVPARAGRIALAVPDGTRVGPWRDLLPGVLRALATAAPSSRRTLLLASGVHAPLPPGPLRAHLRGETGAAGAGATADADGAVDPFEGWEIVQNGDDRFRGHVAVGTTPAGTPVRLHPAWVAADFRVLLGEVSWHYFAGYGGGRKLVFPGLADPAGVAANHRRAVALSAAAAADPGRALLEEITWRPECGPGQLEGNPVHADLEAAAALAPPHWGLTLVECPPRDPDPAVPERFAPRIEAGPYPGSFEAAAAAFERAHRVALTTAPTALVADGGGRPRDTTFLQAHKSLQHALRFLAPGGKLLLFADCGEGLGSAMLARYAADPPNFRPFAGGAEDPQTVLHIQTLIALRRAARAADVGLCSRLPAPVAAALGLRPFGDREEALAWLASGAGAWGWLPRAERFLPTSGWRGGCLA